MKKFIEIINHNLTENRIWEEQRYLDQNILVKVERKTQGMSLPLQKSISSFIVKLIKKEPKFFKKLTTNDLRSLPGVTDWDIKDINNGTLVKFTPPVAGFFENIDHIIDWLSDIVTLKGVNALQQLRGLQNFNLAVQHADKYFADKNKKVGNVEDSIEKEGTETILTLTKGVRWVKVFSPECLDREGKMMGHCVGSYASKVSGGDTEIYSLRDNKNEPHVTIEFSTEDNTVYQIKGKGNKTPVKEYWPYVVDFLKLPFVENIRTRDFDINELSTEQQDSLFKTKPNLAPAIWLYRKEGLTPQILDKLKSELYDNFSVDTKAITVDPHTNNIIVDEGNIEYFVDTLAKDDRRSDNAIKYALKILNGEDTLDVGSQVNFDSITYMLSSLSEEIQDALYAYVKDKYKEEPDNIDDLYSFLDNEGDDLIDELRTAYRYGEEAGIYKEISDDFWKTIRDWDGDGFHLVSQDGSETFDSNWRLEIDPETFIKETQEGGVIYGSLQDNGTWTQDHGIYLDQPYYGWDGFDKHSAEDYLKGETELADYVSNRKLKKAQVK